MKRHAPIPLVLLTLTVLIVGVVRAERLVPQPVPVAEARKQAFDLIRDVFKAEYAKKRTEDQLALAAILLKQGRETEGLIASKYVLLREAADIASQHGGVETTLESLEALATAFDVKHRDLVADALPKLVVSADGPEANALVTAAAMRLTDELVAADDFDGAIKNLLIAERAALKTKDIKLVADVRQKRKEVLQAKQQFAWVAKSAQMLKTSPDDPQANLDMGRYACFIKGDWAGGLPLLVKGSDENFKALAQRELAGPADANAQFKLANDWWMTGEKLTGGEKDQVLAHSAAWYEQALPSLTGFTETIATRRIAEASKLSAVVAGPVSSRGRRIDLIKLFDEKRVIKGQGKWRVEKDELICDDMHLVPRVQFPYQPPAEYDFIMEYSQPALRNSPMQLLPNGLAWQVGGRDGVTSFTLKNNVDGKNPTESRNRDAFEVKKHCTSIIKVRRNKVQAYVNGKLMAEYKPGDITIVPVSWFRVPDNNLLGVGCDDPTVFHKIEVIEVTGSGTVVK